ncbi:uncharacterized protein LOC132952417, partial [Metopolophium dirhodum]|uniref:uncharacterized protein LOC132952417 n=1 Tax=Metopolophium dirhodum TaxID=44670 RepID=UPI00299011A1
NITYYEYNIRFRIILQCNIFKIHRVNAPVMYGMYLLHKEEIQLANGGNDVKEKVLYHVTSESNAVESLISGLDWRRNQRSRFGSGVSFSNNADYCNFYANKSTNKVGVRVIIVSTVLLNETYLIKKWNKENRLFIPPGTADTTVSPNGHVFVKYYDFESYPMFFVYYRWTPEILNESKFFISKTNYNLQRLQPEEHMLCEQVADLHIAESSSLQLRRQSTNKKRVLKQQRRAAAKAKAEAEAASVVAAPLLQRRRRKASKQRRQRQRRAAAKAGEKCETADAKAEAEAEAAEAKVEAEAEAKEEVEAEAASLLKRQRPYDSKHRRQRLCCAAAKADTEAEAAEAADLLRRQRRYDSKQRRQRLSRAAAKAEATL